MWEKIRVIFTIPELRQKILLHAAVPGHLSRRLPDPAADRRSGEDDAVLQQQPRRRRRHARSTSPCSAPASLSQVTIFGLGIMPYISASIIFQLLGSVWPPLEAAAKGRRERPQEDQRIHALRHGRCCASAKAGSTWAS